MRSEKLDKMTKEVTEARGSLFDARGRFPDSHFRGAVDGGLDFRVF